MDFQYDDEVLLRGRFFIWMIIGWLASFKDFLKLDLSLNMAVVMGLVIAFISIGITKLLPRIRLAGHGNQKGHGV